MDKYSELIENIISFGNRDDRIIAIVMVGSQAREENTADQYSDLDLIMIVQDANYFVNANKWLSEIGKHHISFLEKTIDGADEKRVLFDGALDVDFVILTENDAKAALINGDSQKMLCNGYRILVDKAGIKSLVPPQQLIRKPYVFPTEIVYVNVVNDFWYHAIWTSKKLLRGEFWAAKFCLDCNMKNKLLWMIEFYEHTRNKSNYNTWYNGRFVDSWAGEDIKTLLADSFAHYEKQDMISSLKKTMELFRHLAVCIAASVSYTYPMEADRYSSGWVDQNLS